MQFKKSLFNFYYKSYTHKLKSPAEKFSRAFPPRKLYLLVV
jgi:hypothetical protein